MNNGVFSIYNPPISNPFPTGEATLREVWEEITTASKGYELRTGQRFSLEEIVSRVREAQNEKDEKKKKTWKSLLPSATFGGVFDYRNQDPQSAKKEKEEELQIETNPEKISKLKEKIFRLEGKKGLLSPSGLVCMDIDHIPQIEELRDKLSQDSEIGLRLLFLSPSGDGLKLVCKSATPIEDSLSFKSVFNSLSGYISQTYGITPDPAPSAINSACYLSYDPEAIYKDSGEFNETLHPYKEEAPQTKGKKTSRVEFSGEDDIEEIIRRIEERGIDITSSLGQKEWATLGYAFANTYGERGREYFHRVSRYYPGYSEKETNEVYNSCMNSPGGTDITHFYNLAKEAGVDIFVKKEEETQRGEKTTTPRETPETPQEEDTLREKLLSMFKFETEDSFREALLAEPEGIKTNYRFKDPEGEEYFLTIPSGGLTLICALAGHCKSTLLRNLALKMTTEAPEGDILYFSFEESKTRTISRLLSTFIARKLGEGNNTDTLKKYYSGSGEILKGEEDYFNKKRKEFFSLLSSGRLQIYSPTLTTPELVQAVRYYLTTGRKVSAIFVDYIQYLQSGKKTSSRTEEILSVVQELHALAKEEGLPVICAAQLNRQTKSPLSMGANYIADSADLTRYAETIINLWYMRKEEDMTTDKEERKRVEELIKRGKKIRGEDYEIGKKGELYARIDKVRGEGLRAEAFLLYSEDSGRIESDIVPGGPTKKTTEKTTKKTTKKAIRV